MFEHAGALFIFSTSRRRYASGFTLLEVLVALIIIGISLGAVFQAFSQSKRISWRAHELTEGARIAQNVLANSGLINAALRGEKKEGVIEGEKGWRFTLSVQPLALEPYNEEPPLEVPDMLRLRLCVTLEGGAKEKSYCLTRWYRR